MHVLMTFQRSGAYKKRDTELTSRINIWYLFVKIKVTVTNFLGVTWVGKMHAFMDFRSSGAYENLDMGLTLNT